MQDMLPWLERGGGNQRRMKRGLAVVQVTLRQDADHVVGVQVNRVGIRRRTITAAPAHDVPGAGSEEVLPSHRGEGRLDSRISDAGGRRDLLRIGPPDDLRFALAIHLGRIWLVRRSGQDSTAFECRVLAANRNPVAGPMPAETMFPLSELDRMLPLSDTALHTAAGSERGRRSSRPSVSSRGTRTILKEPETRRLKNRGHLARNRNMLWGGRRGKVATSSLHLTDGVAAMPQPNDLSRSLVALDQNSTIIAVVELSQSSWLVGGVVPGIERQPRKQLEPTPERLLAVLHRWRDEAVRAGRTITRIALAFEAGRDGFWLARWLEARGIEAHVIHPSSVAVSREHRRAKTDRLDTELLKR